MDFTILFDKDNRTLENHGQTAFSRVLYIPPGKTALLSMYNMTGHQDIVTDPTTGESRVVFFDCITIHKISYGRVGDLIVEAKCNDRVDLMGEVMKLLARRRVYFEPVLQKGCAWTLDACNNFALIPTPGFYMLEFTDPNQFDTAYVEYALLDAATSVTIPDAFKLGS